MKWYKHQLPGKDTGKTIQCNGVTPCALHALVSQNSFPRRTHNEKKGLLETGSKLIRPETTREKETLIIMKNGRPKGRGAEHFF